MINAAPNNVGPTSNIFPIPVPNFRKVEKLNNTVHMMSHHWLIIIDEPNKSGPLHVLDDVLLRPLYWMGLADSGDRWHATMRHQ